MFTIRTDNGDVQVPDLPDLAAKLRAGEVTAETAVYDHEKGVWTTVGAVTAPPSATSDDAPPAQAVPPPPPSTVTPEPRSDAGRRPSTLGRVIGWGLCGLIALAAVGGFSEGDTLAALIWLLCVVVFCPPIVESARRSHPWAASWPARIAVAVVLLALSGLFMGPDAPPAPSEEASIAAMAKPEPETAPAVATPAPTPQPPATPTPTVAPPGTDVVIELVRAEASANDSYWSLTFKATNLSKTALSALNTTVTVEGTDGLPMGSSDIVRFDDINPGQYQVDEQIWDKRGPIGKVLVNVTHDFGSNLGLKVVVRSLVPGLTAVLQ